jgi:hypothetical protein
VIDFLLLYNQSLFSLPRSFSFQIKMPRHTRSKASKNRHYQIRKYLSRPESQAVTTPSPPTQQQHVGVQVVDEKKTEMRSSLVVAANLITNLASERELWQQQQQQHQQQQRQWQQQQQQYQ